MSEFILPENADPDATFWFGVNLRKTEFVPGSFDPLLGTLEGNKWPAHITLFPPIYEKRDGGSRDKLLGALGNSAVVFSPFFAYPLDDACFDGNTPVRLIDRMTALHFMVRGAVDSYGYTGYYNPQYVGEAYNAHTSQVIRESLPTEPIYIDHIGVFANDGGQKKLVRKIPLGEKRRF